MSRYVAIATRGLSCFVGHTTLYCLLEPRHGRVIAMMRG